MLPPPRQSVIANEILNELVREKPIAKLKKTYPSFIAFPCRFLGQVRHCNKQQLLTQLHETHFSTLCHVLK